MNKQVDFKAGYELAVKNAKAHLKATEILTKEVNYGIANSHLILAAKECLKAYIIFPAITILNYH